MSPNYYTALLLSKNSTEHAQQLGFRLADAEEAATILRAKGYEGTSLAAIVRKIPPANLKHS